MIKKDSIKIIDCFIISGLGIIAEIQHFKNGIAPNTEVFNLETGVYWVIKKRVFSGILIASNSEKYFDCETESMHVDFSFNTLKQRESMINNEIEKKEKKVFIYI